MEAKLKFQPVMTFHSKYMKEYSQIYNFPHHSVNCAVTGTFDIEGLPDLISLFFVSEFIEGYQLSFSEKKKIIRF